LAAATGIYVRRILICHVQGNRANLIAILLHQIFKPARIAGCCDEAIAGCERSSAMLRPKPLALPVTDQTLDMKILHPASCVTLVMTPPYREDHDTPSGQRR
jgi:hypothetical protein